MAQIDPFLARLIESRAQRALFLEDAPLQVHHDNGTVDGSVTSGEQIRAFVAEILPPELQDSWSQTQDVRFLYQSPYGLFQMRAHRVDGRLKLEMEAGEGVVPAPLQPAAVQQPSTPSVAPLAPNNSGTPGAELPQELRGFNFGAFLMSWIWAIGNKSWVGLLGLIPCLGFFVRFWLGFAGNKMAWKSRKWESVQQFRKVQRIWMIVGLVFAGIGILTLPIYMAVFFPVFARTRENARRASCQTNLRVIAAAISQYKQDNNGEYPPNTVAQDTQSALGKYVTGNEVFNCPSYSGPSTSYEYLSPANASNVLSEAQLPIAFDSESRHLVGQNVAFGDGRVKWMSKAEWDQLMGFK